MGKAQIKRFLSHLVTREHVAAATQNQAFNAFLFLSRIRYWIYLFSFKIFAVFFQDCIELEP